MSDRLYTISVIYNNGRVDEIYILEEGHFLIRSLGIGINKEDGWVGSKENERILYLVEDYFKQHPTE